MDKKYAIEMKNITKYYQKKDIIFKNLNLSFGLGEIIGLIGENGSGKTTFIKLISGMTKQNIGEIYILGEKISNEKDMVNSRNYISILGDANRALYWNLTGTDNLEYFWTIKTGKKKSEISNNIKEYIKNFNMGSFIDKKVETYSKGMKQRLLLLISLINSPKILFMDEPLNGLDFENAIIFKQMIHKYSKDMNGTVILTSHDQNFLNEICDEQYIISDKTIIKSNSYNKIIRNINFYIKFSTEIIRYSKFDHFKYEKTSIDEVFIVKADLNDTLFYETIAELLREKSIEILEARMI